MQAALVFPQTTDVMGGGDSNSFPPYGIFYLAAILRDHGHQVHTYVSPKSNIFDESFISNVINDCDILGLSANSINWRYLRAFSFIARSLRPDMPIILGGIHASAFDKHALNVTPADYVVRGEGEITFLELLDALMGKRELSKVKGLTYRDKSGNIVVNPDRSLLSEDILESQPVPAYDLLPLNEYNGIAIESSRGCANNCAFCSIPYRGNYRFIGPKTFVSRLKKSLDIAKPRLISSKGKTPIYILDDCFTISSSRVKEIFEMLIPLKNDVYYGLEARADQINEETVKAMSEHEFWLIQMGLESGYSDGLNKINKAISLEDIEKACKILRDYGLSNVTNYSFIIGLPWETKADCLRTLDYALYLHLKFGGHISINWYEPFPGSFLWEKLNRDKFPVELGIYDGQDCNWREDLDIFHRLHPLLCPNDIDEVEETVAALAILDHKYLQYFKYFHNK